MKIVSRTDARLLIKDRGIWFAVHTDDPYETNLFYGPHRSRAGYVVDPCTHLHFFERPELFTARLLEDPLTFLMELTL